jgi:carbon-monoxide dehydrogenase small subunit
VPARRLLSDCIRHDLRLTGTHVGCEHGVCGACTVLVDGVPMRSCLMLAVSADGSEITTVEGLAEADGSLSPVQQAFQDCHGLQCGFCTPGFLTTITAGLRDNPAPTEDDARELIGGNLCRCTGYQNIVKAVLRAAEIRQDRP